MQSRRHVSLHEHHSMELMSSFGISVPRGELATTPDQARDITKTLGTLSVVTYYSPCYSTTYTQHSLTLFFYSLPLFSFHLYTIPSLPPLSFPPSLLPSLPPSLPPSLLSPSLLSPSLLSPSLLSPSLPPSLPPSSIPPFLPQVVCQC